MRILIIFAMLTVSAVAQNGFANLVPDKPVNFSQVGDSYIWVKGHWVGPDMVGPSVSEIACDRSTMKCTDTSATIYSNGPAFSLDSNEQPNQSADRAMGCCEHRLNGCVPSSTRKPVTC